MVALKALGPERYHAYFSQQYRTIVGNTVCKTVQDILGGKEMPAGLNDTFLSLIRKVNNPQKVTQFKRIGLCNVVYKMVTKCIVHKLKDLMSPLQSNFVPGRQIGDNVIIMHSMHRKKGKKWWMTIKLDLENAYDRIQWSFLKETLEGTQLPNRLVTVTMRCVTSCALSILWNGAEPEKFKPTRHPTRRSSFSVFVCSVYGEAVPINRVRGPTGEVASIPDKPRWAQDTEPPVCR